MKNKREIIMIVFMLVLMTGCGYTTRASLPANYRKIHIELFDNRIDFTDEAQRNVYIPLLEVKTRNAIVDRYLFDGNLKIAERENADLILSGALVNYKRGALRYTDNDDVEEYRVSIIVSIKLTETDTGKTVWAEPQFAGEATYFASGPLVTSEESAIDEAIVDLSRRIVERTIENW